MLIIQKISVCNSKVDKVNEEQLLVEEDVLEMLENLMIEEIYRVEEEK